MDAKTNFAKIAQRRAKRGQKLMIESAPRSHRLGQLLIQSLSCYPVVVTLARYSHDTDLVNLMCTSREIFNLISASGSQIRKLTCGGGEIYKPGCWGCGGKICVVCRRDSFFPEFIDLKMLEENPDIIIQHPAADYVFSPAKLCCFACFRRPYRQVQTMSRERISQRQDEKALPLLPRV